MLVHPHPPLWAGAYFLILYNRCLKHSIRRRSLSYGLQSSSYSTSSSEAGDSQTESLSESDEYSSCPSGSSRVSARAARRTSHPATSTSSLVLHFIYPFFFLKINRRLAGTHYTSGHASGHAQINDTVAAIRLRTRHHDPYEEWAKRTRRDAFVCFMCLKLNVPLSAHASHDLENSTACSHIGTKSTRCSANGGSRTGCQKASRLFKPRSG